MKVKIASVVLGAAAMLGFAGTASASTVTADRGATAAVQEDPCGYWEDWFDAYYRNCSDAYALVHVDRADGYSDYNRCVGPWQKVYLGGRFVTNDAWQVGFC